MGTATHLGAQARSLWILFGYFPSPSPSNASGSPVCPLQYICTLDPSCCFLHVLPSRPFFTFQSMFLPSSKSPSGILSHLGIKSQSLSNLCPMQLFNLLSHHLNLLPPPLQPQWGSSRLLFAATPRVTLSRLSHCTPFTSLRSQHEGHLLTHRRWTPSHGFPSPCCFALSHSTHYYLTNNLPIRTFTP